MSDITPDALRTLAKAAPAGPWANLDGGSFGYWYVSQCVDGKPDPAGAIVTATRDLATGDYLAAVAPSTVLALLDRIEARTAERDYWVNQALAEKVRGDEAVALLREWHGWPTDPDGLMERTRAFLARLDKENL